MKLPNAEQAEVTRSKVVDYLLCEVHPTGAAKAKFFLRMGFDATRWREFASALGEHARTRELVKSEESPFGQRYTVEGRLDTPSGRHPWVRTVWFMERGKDRPRLVTAYPCAEGKQR